MPLTNGIYFAEYTPRQADNSHTLVYIHDAGGSSLFWPGALRRFANHHTISIDLPGHGKSDPPGRQSVENYSQIIEAWLADLSLKKTVLVGFGLGGSIATQIAIHYPHLAQGLVLINTIVKKYIPESTINNLTNPVTAQNAIKQHIQQTLQLRKTNEHHRSYINALQTVRPAVLAGDFSAKNENIFIKSAEHIKQPVCIIESNTGKNMLTPEQNHALHLIPEATVIFSEQNSQLLPIDATQWTATQIRTFLRNINNQQSTQTDSGYYIDLDINEEGNYAIRTD
jgi:surfactin synthase thioesterase subunit